MSNVQWHGKKDGNVESIMFHRPPFIFPSLVNENLRWRVADADACKEKNVLFPIPIHRFIRISQVTCWDTCIKADAS